MFKKLLSLSIIMMLILVTGCEKKTNLHSTTDKQDIKASNGYIDNSADTKSVSSQDTNIINSQADLNSNAQTQVQASTKVAVTAVTTATVPATTKPVATTKATTKATTAKPTTTKPSTQQTAPISNTQFVAEVLRLCNIERQNAGIAPLSASTQLNQAAAIRANEIITSFSHTRPDGTSCFTVLKQLNISYNNAGENIAAGQKTPQEVVTGWMNSEGHRKNILNPAFNKLGVGYVTGGSYGHNWVQVFTN